MNPVSLNYASHLPGAPTRQNLSLLSKKDNPPGYLINDGTGWKVDIDDPEWIEYTEARLEKEKSKPVTKKPQKKPQKKPKQKIVYVQPPEQKKKENQKIKYREKSEKDRESLAELQRQKLEKEIENKEIANQHAYLKLKSASHDIIDFRLAEFLFTGYLEKYNLEMLRYPGRLKQKIILIVQDIIRDPDSLDAGVNKIITEIRKEEETNIRETKAAQKLDIEKWRDERDKK
jgi:hypothetical protein